MKSNIFTSQREFFINSKIQSYQNKFSKLGYYDIVFIEIDKDGTPIKNKDEFYIVFTSKELAARSLKVYDYLEIAENKVHIPNSSINLKAYMLGDLVFSLCDTKKTQFIKVNPILTLENSKEVLLHEELIFIPIKDSLTEKYMLTPPEEAMALLALNPEDQKRMGMEMVFYCVTNKNLPDRNEERESVLAEMIDELSFIGPRVPIKRGSGSLLCVILNLENSMEETAFIRSYKTLDEHSDVIFVTSDLKIKTGDLHQINYDGDSIDTIFGPLINWQKGQENLIYL